ncbi:hypothetical protein [Enterobacter bugandensis]|uniref:hypothetical protein n=1 Tax=Enterobacter bugandensis TaxID=881260 RepID=UPI0020050158|nr:hypothetical protein [Enterobacter bugandensis]MCK7089384.1 hypothetical protein [Enterobacter bugandensis]
MQSDILNTEVTTIDGDNTTLESYKGKVLLIVNVASKCGLTPQAVAPEESGFYERMASKGRAPLYPDDILWNFEKFLIGRDGQVVQRFSPDMTPEDPIVMESIKLALAK